MAQIAIEQRQGFKIVAKSVGAHMQWLKFLLHYISSYQLCIVIFILLIKYEYHYNGVLLPTDEFWSFNRTITFHSLSTHYPLIIHSLSTRYPRFSRMRHSTQKPQIIPRKGSHFGAGFTISLCFCVKERAKLPINVTQM